MRRLSIVIGVLVTAAATACLGSVSAPTEKAIPYAVIYGRIGAPALTFNITVDFSAYKDSAAAVHDSSAAFAGSFAQGVDTGNLYQAVVPAAAPATYFINIFATGQGTHGFVSSVDTFRALRVRFDSIGGGPHDSIEVDDSLP